MTIFGIGPILAIISMLYLFLTLYLTGRNPLVFEIRFINSRILILLGSILLIAGILFLIFTLNTFYSKYKEGVLITVGTFSLCRNPIYSSFIVFIIPAISLLLNSWLSLTTSFFMYILFKILIRKEYDFLKEKFGEQYNEYEKQVNEILPFPKWLRRRLKS